MTNKYKDTIRVETYQWMESFCKGNPKGVMNYFKSFNYIVADEYHYLLTDAAINKKIDEKTVDKLFIALMVLMIVINIYNIYKFM